MKYRALVAVVVAAALSAPSAAPAADGTKVTQSLAIARDAWPGSPCAGRETIQVNADAALAAVGDGRGGDGAKETCTVRMASGMDPYQFCVSLVHEFGHLAGHDHTATGIMSPSPIEWRPCFRADVQRRAAKRHPGYQWHCTYWWWAFKGRCVGTRGHTAWVVRYHVNYNWGTDELTSDHRG